MKFRAVAGGVLMMLGMAGSAAGQPGLGRIEVGGAFPAVEFPALADGRRMSMADFRGKPTVLIVFASW